MDFNRPRLEEVRDKAGDVVEPAIAGGSLARLGVEVEPPPCAVCGRRRRLLDRSGQYTSLSELYSSRRHVSSMRLFQPGLLLRGRDFPLLPAPQFATACSARCRICAATLSSHSSFSAGME